MDKQFLWNAFAATGKVEDYLRYRGIDLPQMINQADKEGSGYGQCAATASDDRRPDSSGV